MKQKTKREYNWKCRKPHRGGQNNMNNILNHRVMKYLLVLVPGIILFLFGLAYFDLAAEIESSLLAEKETEKRRAIDLIAENIDTFIAADADWGVYDYESILSAGIAQIDARAFTYAALYDEALDNVSARTPSYSSSYEPLQDPAFRSTVQSNANGTYIMPFTPEGDATRDMHLYYRWIPSDDTLEGRYLAIVAISRYSVENTLPRGVWTLPAALCATVTIAVTGVVWLLCFLGDIYINRKGTKWRGSNGT